MQIALIIGYSTDVTLERVNVTNNTGIGMLIINAMNSITMEQVFFNKNRSPNCSNYRPDAAGDDYLTFVGGGVVMIYDTFKVCPNGIACQQNTSVIIMDSHFSFNRDCSFTGAEEQYAPLVSSINGSVQSSGGGGISFLIAQTDFTVDVVVSDSEFFNNEGRFGGAFHLSVFLGSYGNSFTIQSCVLNENAVITSYESKQYIMNKRPRNAFFDGGGGIAVFHDVNFPFKLLSYVPKLHNTLRIDNSSFSKNEGRVGGALRVYLSGEIAPRLNITIADSNFSDNRAIIGAAIYANENRGLLGDHNRLNIIFRGKMNFIHNIVNQFSNYNVDLPHAQTGGLSFDTVNVIIYDTLTVENSVGTGLLAANTEIHVLNESILNFINNNAVHGGGMRLLSFSFIVLHKNSTLHLLNNTAQDRGGAIYVDESAFTIIESLGYFQCFLYFTHVEYLIFAPQAYYNLSDLQVNVTFAGNYAPVGSMVYGSELSTCSWLVDSGQTSMSVYEMLYRNYSDQFHFDRNPSANSSVATGTRFFKVPKYITNETTVLYPGQQVEFSVESYDGFNQTVDDVILSKVSFRSDGVEGWHAILDDTNFVLLNGNTTTELHINSSNTRNVTGLIDVVSTDTSAKFQLQVQLTECPVGFEFKSELLQCTCREDVMQVGIVCDVSKGSLLIKDEVWVGLNSDNDLVIVEHCYEDFCALGVTYVYPYRSDYDSQCSEGYHRTGIGCGKCIEGYSNVLGSNRCYKCTNDSLGFVVMHLLLIILAIFAILFVSYIDFTVSDGFLNGIIFYCNIVNNYRQQLAPELYLYYVLAPTGWISLHSAIPHCLYSGMNAVHDTFIQFFPAIALVVCTIVLTILPRYFKCSRNFGLSTIKTVVTVLLLVYARIVENCFRILALTEVYNIDKNETSYRWANYPTQEYFQGIHGFLCAIAIMLIIGYLIPFLVLFLWPQRFLRGRLALWLKPFYDAYTNPFHEKFVWWPGARLVFRLFSYFVVAYVYTPVNELVMILSLMVLVYVHLVLHPFKDAWRNSVDAFFEMNLIVLFLGSIYYRGSADPTTTGYTVYVSVTVGTAYALIVAILMYYMLRKLLPKCRRRVSKSEEPASPTINSSIASNEEDPLIIVDAELKNTRAKTTFTELRESMLASEDTLLFTRLPDN